MDSSDFQILGVRSCEEAVGRDSFRVEPGVAWAVLIRQAPGVVGRCSR